MHVNANLLRFSVQLPPHSIWFNLYRLSLIVYRFVQNLGMSWTGGLQFRLLLPKKCGLLCHDKHRKSRDRMTGCLAAQASGDTRLVTIDHWRAWGSWKILFCLNQLLTLMCRGTWEQWLEPNHTEVPGSSPAPEAPWRSGDGDVEQRNTDNDVLHKAHQSTELHTISINFIHYRSLQHLTVSHCVSLCLTVSHWFLLILIVFSYHFMLLLQPGSACAAGSPTF